MTGIELCKKCAKEKAILERKKKLLVSFDDYDEALFFVNTLRHQIASILKCDSIATLMDVKDLLGMTSDYYDCQLGFTKKSVLDWSVRCINGVAIEILMNDLEVLYDMEHTDIFYPEEYYDEIIKKLQTVK